MMVQPAKPAADTRSPLTRALVRFIDWWTGELAALVPARIRQWWSESDRVLFLRFDDAGRAMFERETIGGHELLLSLDTIGNEEIARNAALSLDLSRRMNGSFRILLCLDNDQMLRRTVTLPLAAEENLRQTLAFEIDRYTPFKLDQVYFDYRIVDRNIAQRKIAVELAVAKQTVVDHETSRATMLGLHVSGVIPIDGRLPPNASFNLLPNVSHGSSNSQALWVRVALVAIAVLMIATLLGIPVWQKRAAAIDLLSPLAEARIAANETERMRERLDTLVTENNLLPDKKWHDFSPLMVLAELSKLLPDDSFVTALDYDGKTVQVQGESVSAAGLVETLDASPMFKEVGFKAPVSKVQGTSGDRFHISATLDLGARPKPVPGDFASAEGKAQVGSNP